MKGKDNIDNHKNNKDKDNKDNLKVGGTSRGCNVSPDRSQDFREPLAVSAGASGATNWLEQAISLSAGSKDLTTPPPSP